MKQWPFFLPLVCLLAVLPACTVTRGEEATAPPTTALPTPTGDPQVEMAREAWGKGPHAAPYALEKGPNTYCARCHSPANWDPAATIDPPPNCVSCKFPTEADPRQAAGNPLVPEEEWAGIGCEVCHRVEAGVVLPETSWRNPQTGYYETVTDNTSLCSRCHRDTETLRHARDLGDTAHASFSCIDCHNAHDATASCTTNGCHSDVAPPLSSMIGEHEDQVDDSGCGECHSPADAHMGVLDFVPVACMDCHASLFAGVGRPLLQQGHGEVHANVTCIACHDAADLESDMREGDGVWTTFRTTQLLGRANREPYQSHQLAKEVDCTRCHFAGNQWGLEPLEEATGE